MSLLIIGGRGALGSSLIEYFKCEGYWLVSIDRATNESADLSITLDESLSTLEQQEDLIEKKLTEYNENMKFEGVICVAGGWAGGNILDSDFLKNADLMWKQSVESSLMAAFIARKFLKEGGLLVLTGAKAALDPTPGMVAYGIAKAAVHHLTRSIGSGEGGMPKKSKAFAILPATLDTPNNRKWMPDADYGSWTPLTDVAKLIQSWLVDVENAPKSGSLISLITKEGKTTLEIY